MTVALIALFLAASAGFLLYERAVEESRKLDDLIYTVLSTPLEDEE